MFSVPTAPTKSSSDGLSPGAIAGIVIAIIVVAILLAVLVILLIVFLVLRRRSRSGEYKPSYDTQGMYSYQSLYIIAAAINTLSC